MFEIIHLFPAYRLEDVGVMSLRQFVEAQRQSRRIRSMRTLELFNGVRVGVNGDGRACQRFLESLMRDIRGYSRTEADDLPPLTLQNAAEFGLRTVEAEGHVRDRNTGECSTPSLG